MCFKKAQEKLMITQGQFGVSALPCDGNISKISEDKKKTIEEMEAQLPEVEKILKKIGTIIVDPKMNMWFLGYGWFLKLKAPSSIYLTIEWSDKRFCILALKGKELTWRQHLDKHRDAFMLCDFTDWVTLEKLESKLQTFRNLFARVKKEEDSEE